MAHPAPLSPKIAFTVQTGMWTSLFAVGSLISVSHHLPGAHHVSNLAQCSRPPFPTLSCTSVSTTRWADVRTAGSCDGGVVLILFQYTATRCSGCSTCARRFAGERTATSVYLYVLLETQPIGARITAGYVHVPLVPHSYLSDLHLSTLAQEVRIKTETVQFVVGEKSHGCGESSIFTQKNGDGPRAVEGEYDLESGREPPK